MVRALRFEYRTPWFAVGRSTLALATASELVFTRPAALFTHVGPVRGPLCAQHSASLFCLGNSHDYLDARRWLAVAALLLVASGFRPRVTAIMHTWIVYSVSVSITLPDGGDAIALIMVLLITPMCLADPRRWQWRPARNHLSPKGRTVSYLSFWALRLQLAYLYADSAIAKMGVADWQNGSAFYYFVRDKMFGSAGPTAPLWLWLSDHAVSTLALTWGAIVLELAITLLTLLDARWRMIAFWLCVLLHTLIFLSMGLFSFSLVMIGAAALAATHPALTPRQPLPTARGGAHTHSLPAQRRSARAR